MIQTNTVVVKIVWMSEWESECERGRDVMSEESEKKRKKQSSTHSSFNKNTNTIHNTFVKKNQQQQINIYLHYQRENL